MARTLLGQADKICTNVPEKTKEKEHVVAALRANGYPRGLVTEDWEPSAWPRQPDESDAPKARVVLPYDRHLSDNLEDTDPLGDPHLFSSSLNHPSDPGTPEGPHTPKAAGRCGIPDPVW